MGHQRGERSQTAAPSGPAVLSGAEAVARAARCCVGDAVAGDPAVAEGLALAGGRAASVGARSVVSPPGALGPGAVSCVHHVLAAPGCAGGGRFELAATTAQEAVDDCLAAHLLSQRLGRSGLCSLAPKLAADLALVELPRADACAGRLADGATPPEPELDPDRVAELAREALAEAGAECGRPLAPVVSEGDADAGLVLVAAGDAAAPVRAALRALARAGVPARAAIVRLVRPFPMALARKVLSGARFAVAVGTPAGPVEGLLAAVRAAAGEKAEVRGVVATGATGLVPVLRELLPDFGIDASRLAALLDPPLAHRLVFAPDTAWAEAAARRVLERLAVGGALRIGRSRRRHRGAGVIAWSGGAVADAAGDLLIAAHPGALTGGVLALLRPQSAVVVLSDAPTAEATGELTAPARTALQAREHRLYWVAPDAAGGSAPAGEADRLAARALAAGAFLALTSSDVPAAFASQPGELRMRRVEPAELASEPPPPEVDFRARSPLPRMPEPVDDADVREGWARWLRRFHRAGAAESSHPPLRSARPAALATLAEELRHHAAHPFVVTVDPDATPPIAVTPLGDACVAALAASGGDATPLRDNLASLVAAAAQVLSRDAPGRPLDALIARAGDELVSELGLAEGVAAALRADLAELRGALPAAARVFDLRPDTPIRVYLEVLAAVRGPLERRFEDEVAGLCESLRDALQLDRMHSEQGHSSAALASEFGGGADRLLDLDALAETLPEDPVWTTLGSRQRERLAEALAILEQHAGREKPLPAAVFLRGPDVAVRVPGEAPIEHPDPLAAAVGVFDGTARSMAPLFRAVRLARLVAAGSYRPELHDELLAGFDWEAFGRDELSLLPAVTVLTTGRQLRRRGQASLSQLLRSSRPVRVIVCDDVAGADEAEDLSRYHLDLGHLVMAHREAFAVSTTLARPQLFVERLARAVRHPRPGVVLVPLPARDSTPWRALLAEAALWGRACPDFLYDPDAGPSWADRFDVAGNPQPECAWPIHEIACLEGGVERTLPAAFTFADAVALEPAYQRHLRVIPRVAWDDDAQVPLADFIAHFDPERGAREIPFLWVVDDANVLGRAVVSRELALACRDRLRSWRVLQELGGFENAYAERAAAAAREVAESEARRARDELDRAHADALASARGDGAHAAMQRLAATLLNRDSLAAVPTAPAGAPVAPEIAAPIADPAVPLDAPEAKEEAEADEPLVLDDPYIDTVLCTSCNECTNLNPRLFGYDGNKQAFIADAGAGTFAELVKAAKLCPAHCIHPGKPRADDASATPELIAEAAKFA